MDKLLTHILVHGEKILLAPNDWLPLQEKGQTWFLETGSVNLFAIQIKNSLPEGPRTLIAQYAYSSLLFDMSSNQTHSSHSMIAIAEEECTIWKIPLREIVDAVIENPLPLHEWINQIALFFKKETSSESTKYIRPSEDVLLKSGDSLSTKRANTLEEKKAVTWLHIQEGIVEFLGYPGLQLEAGKSNFPLTYYCWIKAKNDSKIHALQAPQDLPKCLLNYHQILRDYLVQRQIKDEAESLERLQKRRQEEEDAISRSLQEMASVINPIEHVEIYSGADPFFRACQILGSFMNISIQTHDAFKERSQLNASTIVSAIAEASGIRYRQVRLKGNWWEKDCGPFLAFYGVDFEPVALIDKVPGHYEMIDPKTASRIKVDEKIAKDIHHVAFCFYHSFPDDLKTGKEVIRFYLKHNLKEFKPLFFYSIVAGLIVLFPPFATAVLFNKIIPETNLSQFWQITIALIIAAVSSSLFLFLRSLIIVRIEGKSSNQIQLGLWDRLLKLPVSFFRRYTAGNLILRVLSTEDIRALLSGNAARVMLSGIFSLFYIIAMFLYAPSLAFIGVGIILLSLILTFFSAKIYSRLQNGILEIQGRINGFLIQIITAVGKLRTTGAEKNAFSRWALLFAENRKLELRAQTIQNIVTAFNYVLPFLSFAFIFAFMIAHKTQFSIGSFLAFNAAFIPFYLAITDLSNTIMQMAPIFPMWKRSKIIVEEPQETLLKKTKPGILSGDISIDDVTFKYDSNGPLVLDSLSIKAHPREFIGIVGPSGCGKSTLVRLLLGFEQPQSGAIYYDEKDLSSLSIKEVRKQLGVVLQGEGIVSGSIRDNIVCGGSYSLEQINHALEISGFKEDVESFPMGLSTFLSMGGSTLSGGQKQRLLIARALLPNPKILIFDEATSALDNKNQETVTNNLEQLDVTRIVIAHRLNTIKNADRIYVFDKGKVIQTGTFAELSVQEGLFAKMLKRQQL